MTWVNSYRAKIVLKEHVRRRRYSRTQILNSKCEPILDRFSALAQLQQFTSRRTNCCRMKSPISKWFVSCCQASWKSKQSQTSVFEFVLQRAERDWQQRRCQDHVGNTRQSQAYDAKALSLHCSGSRIGLSNSKIHKKYSELGEK